MAQPATNNTAPATKVSERVLQRLQSLSASRIEHRQRQIRRQIRANGVIHSASVTGEFDSRPWKLDLVPCIVEESDWKTLAAGLNQHARLRAAMFSDIYSERELIHQRIVPPQCILAHSGYMRAAHRLAHNQTLPLYSTEVARAHDGSWKLLADIPESLQGCGYALENRDVLSRVLATLFRTSSVERLNGFIGSLQQMLLGTADPDARCVILGYGAKDPRILEYSYFAKYLGCTLVALSDLVVKDKRVWLKTIDGLQRVDIIMRVVADQHLDPLSSASGTSTSGIPGLLSAARSGNVTIVNPPGVDALANPAFAAYHSQLCKFYLNEDPLLQPRQTLWLGDHEQREAAFANLENLIFKNINDSTWVQHPSTLDEPLKEQLRRRINQTPSQFVAIEPAQLLPEPFVSESKNFDAQQSLGIRTFMLRRDDHYLAMPGGLGIATASAAHPETTNTNPNPCESEQNNNPCNSKDVWVVGVRNHETTNARESGTEQTAYCNYPSAGFVTLDLANHSATHASFNNFAAFGEALPSRLAENLFWFGRYTERTENTLRLLRTTLQQFQSDDMIEDSKQHKRNPQQPSVAATCLLRTLTASTGTFPGFIGDDSASRLRAPDEELLSLINDATKPGTLMFTLKQLQFSADEIRERISPDLYGFLNQLDDLTAELAIQPLSRDLITDSDELNLRMMQFGELLTILVAIAGLTHENLTRGDGWRFITLGRRIERARFSANVLHCALSEPHPMVAAASKQHDDNTYPTAELSDGSAAILENLLHVFDSIMTYRSRYRGELSADKVVHLLLQDESNPRSVGFQLAAIESEILQLPDVHRSHKQHRLLRLATSGLSRVRLADAPAVLQSGWPDNSAQRYTFSNIMQSLESIPAELANCLAANYFTHTEIRNALGSQT